MNKNQFHNAIGTVIFGLVLEEAGESEESIIGELHKVVEKIKTLLGDQEAVKHLKESKQAIGTIIYACLDWAILTRLTEPTMEAFKKLPPEQKILAELFYLNYTGRSMVKSGDNDRWPGFLWSIKKSTEKYLKTTALDITADQILEFLKPIVIQFYLMLWKELKLQD